MTYNLFFLILTLLVHRARAIDPSLTWCGKYYQQGSPTSPPSPSSKFQIPPISTKALLSFSCTQANKPYVKGDDGNVIVDMEMSYRVGEEWTEADSGSGSTLVRVQVDIDGKPIGVARDVSLNTTGNVFPVDLTTLTPQAIGYNLTCTATSASGQIFSSASTFFYLPPNVNGSVVKSDATTGALLIPTDEGKWEPLFPFGFYTTFSGYLDGNLSVLDEMKALGINTIHPIPTFDNLTALNLVLDRMEELELWLVYDMRWSYMNLTAVTEQVNAVKTRKNLLAWYTADEPDGPGDPLDAPLSTYNLINSLDGYHPISLVLNCADYEFSNYVAGADIVLTDPYPLYVDVHFSRQYATVCNTTFGCCGCDNCIGDLTDIATRLDAFYNRIDLMERKRSLTVWTVLQAFGSSEFWFGTPTGQEYLAMAVLSLNHGTTGITSWLLPTTPSILSASTLLAAALPTFVSYALTPSSTRIRLATGSEKVDVAWWTTSDSTTSLISLVNLNNGTVNLSFPIDGEVTTVQRTLLNAGGVDMSVTSDGSLSVAMEAFGTGIFELSTKGANTSAGGDGSGTGQASDARRLKLPWDRGL